MGRLESRNTRSAILDTAEDILQRRSFNSFSYSHVSQSLGLRTASLHYHFPTKSDLGIAVLERYRERFRAWCETGAGSERSAFAQLEAYVADYESCLSRSHVCVGGVLGVEYNTLDESMREALQRLYGDHYAWLGEVLERGRSEGVFVFPGSARAQAAVLSTTLQGALQQARSCGVGHFRLALDQLLALLTPPP